jgi:hypothetical protein
MKKRSFGFLMILFAALFCAVSFSQEMVSVSSALTAADDKSPEIEWMKYVQTLQPNDAADQKGPVTGLYANQGEMQTLGSVWQVTECCGWTGTWTRRPGTNTFDAKWRHTNGTTAQDVITLQSWHKYAGTITLKRQSINGTYTGTVNTQTRKITQGTASWYQPGETWSASY